MAKIRWVTTIKSTKYKLKTVKAQLDSVSLVMFATRPRPMVWYYALPTGHLCIYLLACAVNLIDTTECLKRSARMVSLSVSGSFRISMECSGFALANPGQIMICICRPVTFPINQTFTLSKSKVPV